MRANLEHHSEQRIAVAAAIVLAWRRSAAGTASARERNHNDDPGAMVDHDGIYLAQRIGQCLNHSGPCHFAGQCPGGEYTHYAYATGRVYCDSFYPPAALRADLLRDSLLGVQVRTSRARTAAARVTRNAGRAPVSGVVAGSSGKCTISPSRHRGCLKSPRPCGPAPRIS